MANLDISNEDMGGIVIGNNEYEDGVLTHSGAGTIDKGSIIARLTATGKWVEYNSGGAGGAEVPTGILTIDSVAAGAGDEPIRPMLTGKVRTEKIIDPNTSIAPTAAVQDLLRDYGILCVSVDELNALDNQ